MWNSLMALKYRLIDSRITITWKLSCDFLLAISVSVDVSYIIFLEDLCEEVFYVSSLYLGVRTVVRA